MPVAACSVAPQKGPFLLPPSCCSALLPPLRCPLQVKAGELVCVVGRVGSGKSSLVQALLGEMERESGHVRVGGCVAYAAQQAWIVNATVKGNVTFGRAFDEDRWEMCVDVSGALHALFWAAGSRCCCC